MIDFTGLCGQTDATSKPFAFEMGGEPWVCATNNKALVAVAGSGDFGKDWPNVRVLIERAPKPTFRVAYHDLLGWLREAGPSCVPCTECDGGKRTKFECDECDGEGEIECYHCGSWVDCKECDGRGHFDKCSCGGTGVESAPGDYARFGARVIDRRLAFSFLERIYAREVLVGVGEFPEPITFRDAGGSWIALVMPVREDVGLSPGLWLPRGMVEGLEGRSP